MTLAASTASNGSRMTAGLVASLVLHLLVVALALVGLPRLSERPPIAPVVSVDLVTLDQLAELASQSQPEPAGEPEAPAAEQPSQPAAERAEAPQAETAAREPPPPPQAPSAAQPPPPPAEVATAETAEAPAPPAPEAAAETPPPAAAPEPAVASEPAAAPEPAAPEPLPSEAARAPEPEPEPAQAAEAPEPEPQPAPAAEAPQPEPERAAEAESQVAQAQPAEPAPQADEAAWMSGITPPMPQRRPQLAERPQPEPEPEPEPPQDRLQSVLRNVLRDREAPAPQRTQQAARPAEPATRGQRGDLPSRATVNALGEIIRQKMAYCWRFDPGARNAGDLIVTMNIELTREGYLIGQPRFEEGLRMASDPAYRAAAENARRAVLECEPYTELPQAQYDIWKSIRLRFDPRQMLGG